MPLTPYRISLTPLPDSGSAAATAPLGQRSRLGGEPDWEQDDETPTCPDCRAAMTFIAQIDSIHHDDPANPHRIDCLGGKQEYIFGDVGLIYVFFCFECCQSEAVFQCG